MRIAAPAYFGRVSLASFLERALPLGILAVSAISVPIMMLSPEGLPRMRSLERDLGGVSEENRNLEREIGGLRKEVQDLIEARIRGIVAGLAATFEMTATVRYERRYPATVNTETETQHAVAAAAAVVGAGNVETDPVPNMGSEDFSFMLDAKRGCYIWLGAGRGPDTPNVHNPRYDFEDAALPIGASYWMTLAEQQLAPA